MPETRSSPVVSIVIPTYRGEATIGPLVSKLDELLAGRFSLRIILVNDGSPDGTLMECRRAQESVRTPVTVVDLSRNFSEHNAVMAGLHHAQDADYAVIMDDDFQNPPTEVLKLIAKAEEGYDVVYSSYERKCHARWRNLGSAFNDLVATFLLGKPRDLYLSSFKLLNRFVIGQVTRYAGPYPYIDGLILRATRRIGTVTVNHDDRAAGRSTYTLTRLIRLWLNMFTGFSISPLRLATVLGFLCSILAFVFGVIVVVEKLQNPGLPVGWASVAFLIVMFAGIQLTLLGIVGEYVGRLFMFQNGAPQFIVRAVYPPPNNYE